MRFNFLETLMELQQQHLRSNQTLNEPTVKRGIWMFKNDVKIDNKMKTIITNDWLKEFPSYKKFRPQVWTKKVGPLSFHMGYEVRYGTDVRIGFSVFNLSNPLDFMCATISVEPKQRRFLTWKKHEEGKYKEAAAELRQLSKVPIEGLVLLSQVIDAYKNYTSLDYETDERYFEDLALLAAWAGKLDLAKELLDWGKPYYEKNCSRSPTQKNTEEWYQAMLKKISNPEALHKTVEEQVIFHKLTKIPCKELIIDMP